jgi:hypothetical protein
MGYITVWNERMLLMVTFYGKALCDSALYDSCCLYCVEWIVILVRWCDFRHGEYEVCVPGSERHDIADQSGGLQPGIGNCFVMNWFKFTECGWGHSLGIQSLCSGFLTKMTQEYMGIAWQVPVSWIWGYYGSDYEEHGVLSCNDQ